MCDILGLEFRQNIIDIYVAPFYSSFSNPMFIATKYTADRAVEVITHELIHRLLTDNIQTSYETPYAKKWKQLFHHTDDLSWNVIVHIPVHAVLQMIFDDVLKESQRTKRDKQMCKNWPDYYAAWEYVASVGYKHIIKQLQQSYKELSEQQ